MTGPEEPSPQLLLDYSTPVVRRHLDTWTAAGRIKLAVLASVLHFGSGFAALALLNTTKFVGAVVVTWFFPFGLVALKINPHQMLEAAIGNSVFCGFVFAYAFALWRARRRNP